jgi:hypothetical protein
MRLVRRHVKRKLNGPHDLPVAPRGNEHGFVARNRGNDVSEEDHRLGVLEWRHEAHRRAAINAVSQHPSDLVDRPCIHVRAENFNFNRVAHAARSSLDATVESPLSL